MQNRMQLVFNVIIVVLLVIATSLTVARSFPSITLILCAVILTGWLTHLFRWGESIARISPETEPRVRGFIVQFFWFYISISYLFSLAYHACAILGYEVRNGNDDPIASLWDCIYFSVITATTLGYGDFTPFHSFVKCLTVLEVSFGVIFITAIITVALSLRPPASNG
jgi:hypothetical protein